MVLLENRNCFEKFSTEKLRFKKYEDKSRLPDDAVGQK